MSIVTMVMVVVFGLPALIFGAPQVYPPLRWDQRRRRLRLAERVDLLLGVALRFLVLLAVTVLGVVALVGSVAALQGDVPLPSGVTITGGAVVGLSIWTLTTFGRPRR